MDIRGIMFRKERGKALLRGAGGWRVVSRGDVTEMRTDGETQRSLQNVRTLNFVLSHKQLLESAQTLKRSAVMCAED